MKYFVRVGETNYELDLDADTVTVNGESVHACLEVLDGTPVHLVRIGDRVYRVGAERGERRGDYRLSLNGYRLEVEALDERTRAIRELSRSSSAKPASCSVTAPMPGLIVRVVVAEGDLVRAGQGVVVMEAMKMENELRAPADGQVKRVVVAPGSAVEKGALLLEIG